MRARRRDQWGRVGDVDFDAVADELYGLPPEEFTAARNDCAKQARADGDRPLADRINALRKPTTAAWLTNQLARDHADEVELLLDLGEELRDVLADIEGDALRELTRQRYQLVSALVQQARSLAVSRGRRVTEDVAQAVRTTLEATLSDPGSSAAVAGGRLTDALEVSGFSAGGVEDIGRPRPSTTAPQSNAGTVADLDAQRRRRERQQAERDVAAVEEMARRAAAASDRAAERIDVAQRAREDAATTVDRLSRDLEQATADLDQRAHDEQQARDDGDEAQRRARKTNEELAQARARLEDLTP